MIKTAFLNIDITISKTHFQPNILRLFPNLISVLINILNTVNEI